MATVETKPTMKTILVIEDDLRIQKALHRLFTAEGYGIAKAQDGSAGLESFRAIAPDAIILDLMLPGLSAGILPGLQIRLPEYAGDCPQRGGRGGG